MVKGSPGVTPKPRFGPNLDSTGYRSMGQFAPVRRPAASPSPLSIYPSIDIDRLGLSTAVALWPRLQLDLEGELIVE